MSAPTPHSSSIPRHSNHGHSVTSSSGPGHAAASRLPTLTHVKNISRKLDGHLKSGNVYDSIRSVLKNYLAEEHLDAATQEEVLAGLRAAGVFGDALTGGMGTQVGFGYEATQQAAEATAASSTHTLTGGGRLVAGKRYLNVRVKGGRAFVDNLMSDEEARSSGGMHVLRLSMEMLGSRCVSAPVPATVEPNFAESFMFQLQDEEREMEPMAPLETLAQLHAPIHLLLTRESSLGTTTLVSSAFIEWRKVLVHGRISLNVELKGSDELALPVGLLELDLEIVPLKMPPNPKELPVFVEYSALQKQLQNDTDLTAAVDSRFHAYAKAWWHDFNCIRPLHQTRLIQIFGLSEERKQRCVCTFVSPLRADRCLDSPLHAARFVRLIPFVKDLKIGGQRTEMWHSAHTMMHKRSGDLEDHAALLCSLLLGFGLDAYIAIGTTHDKGAHIWVVTRGGAGEGPNGGSGIVFWESLTGQRFELDNNATQKALIQAGLAGGSSSSSSAASSSAAAADASTAAHANGGGLAARSGVSPAFPFHRVHCLFNHRSFYANAQLEDEVHLVDWRLDVSSNWKAMNERALEVLPRRPQIFLRAPTLQPHQEEKSLERKMRELVENYRREYANLSTSWSADFSYVLGPALASYESERVTGACFGNAEFQQAIKRTVPFNCVFKGVPFQFTSLNPSIVFASMLSSRALVELITADGSELRFGMRVKVVMYPEDVVAVWIMIASIKKADDFLTQNTKTYQ